MSLIRQLQASGATLLACLVIAVPANAAVIEFFDPDMSAETYDSQAFALPGFTTSVTTRVGVGGVGTAIQTFSEVTGPSSPGPRITLVNSSFAYDPSVGGEISSIDASFAQLMTLFHNTNPVSLATAPAILRLFAFQDGAMYRVDRRPYNGLSPDTWQSIGVTGIVESDFLFFDPDDPFGAPGTAGLDFGGSAITFGLQLAHFGVTSGGAPSTGVVRSTIAADNFRVTLHTIDPVGAVPEPATWALMIGGFGMAGATLRRSRRLQRTGLALT